MAARNTASVSMEPEPSSEAAQQWNPHPMPEQPRGRRAPRRMAWLPWAVAALLVLAIAGCVYYYMQYQKLKMDPSVVARQEAQRVVDELSRVMVVPNDPNPVIATVSDKDKLKGQPFFDSAENGDEVIIFPASMKAVLYRPSAHKVVDIAPLATGQAPGVQPGPAPAPSKKEASTTDSH